MDHIKSDECVRSMDAARCVAIGERIQVLSDDEDCYPVWAAARVARIFDDGRFTVEVIEWAEIDGAPYEDGPFNLIDKGTLWRRPSLDN